MTSTRIVNKNETFVPPSKDGNGLDGNHKHDVSSDSATPETGDEEADHSIVSEKLGSDDQEISLPVNGKESSTHSEEQKRSLLGSEEDCEGPATKEVRKNAIEVSGEVHFEYEGGQNGKSLQVDAEQKLDPSDDYEEDDDSSIYSAKPDSLLWQARMFCGRLVNNEYVQVTIICLIIINALMMGLATFDFVRDDPQVDEIFFKIDRGFLVIFTIEVAMQLFYLGATLFVDGWLVFDLLIVIFSWSFESLQIVRAFRIFRAFRLITRVKPLRDLVLAIGAVMPRMYAIAALLLLIFYIFSVLFTELFSELPLSDTFFTTLDTSLFTCMEMMTLEWGEIAREVMIHEPWAWAPFSAFIMITGFIVFNLIVAVVCDAVAVTEKTVRELDGFESDNPVAKLAEAQERIDLLQCHINDMLRTQENVQNMIELMAGELLHLEAERMKAENREAELRIEVNRRAQYEKSMSSRAQIQSLERNYIAEKERRESEKRMKELRLKESIEEEAAEKPQSRQSRLLPNLDRRSISHRGSQHKSRRNLSSSHNASRRNLSSSHNATRPDIKEEDSRPTMSRKSSSKNSFGSFASEST